MFHQQLNEHFSLKKFQYCKLHYFFCNSPISIVVYSEKRGHQMNPIKITYRSLLYFISILCWYSILFPILCFCSKIYRKVPCFPGSRNPEHVQISPYETSIKLIQVLEKICHEKTGCLESWCQGEDQQSKTKVSLQQWQSKGS